jgi:hypothetical protein
VQQKKETQEIGKQIDRYTIINKIETPAQKKSLIHHTSKWCDESDENFRQ